jgi:hypothetical protein
MSRGDRGTPAWVARSWTVGVHGRPPLPGCLKETSACGDSAGARAAEDRFHGPVGPDEAATPLILNEQMAEHVEVGGAACIHLSVNVVLCTMWAFAEH